jgi:hypothetical protein
VSVSIFRVLNFIFGLWLVVFIKSSVQMNILGKHGFHRFATECIEERGRDRKTEDSRSDQASHDGYGNGSEDFSSRFMEGQKDWDESYSSGESRHEDG